MKYIANPLVRWILQSPFHSLLSGSTMLITVFGRKSGKPISLPVQYAQTGNLIFVIPGTPEKKTWWKNLRGGAAVSLTVRGQLHQARAEILDGAADCADILPGLALYFQRFPPAARMHQVNAGPDGKLNPADLQRAAETTILVRIELPA